MLVLGLGISGIESVLFLRRLGIRVIAVEREDGVLIAKGKYGSRLPELAASGAELIFGVSGEALSLHLSGVSLALLSPGVPRTSTEVQTINAAHIPCTTELALGLAVQRRPTVIVTGSNGKTTTVHLITHLLRTAGRSPSLVGNVGTPVVTALGDEIFAEVSDDRPLVVEASSYQLEDFDFVPQIGIFLNLSDNHLERHGTMERYFDAKANLFRHMSAAESAIINVDDQWGQRLLQATSASILSVSTGSFYGDGARIEYDPRQKLNSIVLCLGGKRESFDLSRCGLLGLHNRYNVGAAICAARLFGASHEYVQLGLKSFAPLEHRIEPLSNIAHPLVLNDSKATTVAATLAAFQTVREAYPDRAIVLLLGGLMKQGSWNPLREALLAARESLRKIVFFGADGARVHAAFCADDFTTSIVPDVRAAVIEARNASKGADVVLFSPGCASFDEFADFEDRGRFFKECAHMIFGSGVGITE